MRGGGEDGKMTLSMRYTVVPRRAASSSRAVPGLMKWDTSAMCTPTWWVGGWVICHVDGESWQW